MEKLFRDFMMAAAVFTGLYSCAPTYSKYQGSYNQKLDPVPDYQNIEYWAAHPAKKDPSDSIPRPLRKDYRPDSTIDVFFLYPTSFTNREDSNWNASITDPALNLKTDYNSILFQASVFNEYRVFSPRYRQAHIRSYFTADTVQALAAFEIAYQDIKKAFEHYLQNENHNRPIIIAAHSQGTTHATRLLKEFFDESELKHRLIAAYLVGMYIPENSFNNISLCKEPSQTNCFCAWRTYETNYIPDFVNKEKGKLFVTNPLSWTDTNDKIERNLNSGSILRKFNKRYTKVAGAQISKGVVWTSKPKFPGSFLLKTKNYHIGDINLYYYSIRNNLRERVKAFKAK